MPSAVDRDDGAFDVEVRIPREIRRGESVDVVVVITGRRDVPQYSESGFDFVINGRGLRNAHASGINAEVIVNAFQGAVGAFLVRGGRFGPGSRIGFRGRFDVDRDAVGSELHFQLSAYASGPRPGRNLVREWVALVR